MTDKRSEIKRAVRTCAGHYHWGRHNILLFWEKGGSQIVRYLDDEVLFGLIDRDLSKQNYDVSVIIVTFQ